MLGRIAASLALAVIVAALWAGGPAVGQVGGDPVLVGAGDIASCESTGVEATASLLALAGIDGTVATFGDNAYPKGTAADFAECYDPFWGHVQGAHQAQPGQPRVRDAWRLRLLQILRCGGWRSQQRILLLRSWKLACDLAEL